MEFSKYYLYEQAILGRDHVVFVLALVVLAAFGLVEFVRWVYPPAQKVAAWLIGLGGFYATLGLMAVYTLARAAGR